MSESIDQYAYFVKYIITIPHTRELLDVMHDMRREGYVIGSSARGYFKPVDVQEAHEYVERVLVSRRNDLSETISAQMAGIVNEYGRQLPLMRKDG